MNANTLHTYIHACMHSKDPQVLHKRQQDVEQVINTQIYPTFTV